MWPVSHEVAAEMTMYTIDLSGIKMLTCTHVTLHFLRQQYIMDVTRRSQDSRSAIFSEL